MTHEIIKPNRDADFYVYWSDNVDAPIMWGTREEFLSPVFSEFTPVGSGRSTEDRLKRTDETSRSALWTDFSWDEDWILIYKQKGTLRRSQLQDFLEAFDYSSEFAKETPAALSMLAPFEGDE